MSIHEFTLRATLPDPESDPAQYVEALYEAGCDDAVLGIGRKGVISLIFTREAETRGAAIASAIADVRSVLDGCEVELDGDLQLNDDDKRFVDGMRAYKECSEKYRNALRALAE